jgi:hypothetical protein
MNVKIQYEKVKVSFVYLGKQYFGEIVCSNIESQTYWFVFDDVDVKPFGGSVEFVITDGELKTVKDFTAYPLFILSIKNTIDKYRKELCN